MKEIYYVPIGYSCSVAQYCRKEKLRIEAYPFDWLISPLNLITKLVKNDFKGFAENFHPIRTTVQTYVDTREKMEVVNMFCKNTHMFFLHDIRASEKLKDEIILVKEKYERRISRLLSLFDERKIVYFITDSKTSYNIAHEELKDIIKEDLGIETKYYNEENDERVLKDEIYEFKMMMKEKYPGLKFKIIQV